RAMARIKSTPKSPAPRKMARLPIVRPSPPSLRFGRVTPAWGCPNPKPSPPDHPPGPVAAQVLAALDPHRQHRPGAQPPVRPAPRKMARLPIVRTSPPSLRFGRVTPAWGSPNPKPSPPVQPPGPVAAQVLDPLDQHHQHRHGDQHLVHPEPLVPVPDGQVAQP